MLLLFIAVYLDKPSADSRDSDIVPPEITASPSDVIKFDDYIPGIQVDIIYAGNDNIFGSRIYDINTSFLRRGTADKLKSAQEEFMSFGYSLKVWDAYRPPSAQYKLWDIFPDSRYVVNPLEGYSYHSRGVAVDVTLVDYKGQELNMPSSYDDFSSLSDRDYKDVSIVSAENAVFLERIMQKYGFESIFSEWWHFADNEKDAYEVIYPSQLP